MREVFIYREYQEKQTIGILKTDGFICKTLELPNKNNAKKISCIPAGSYICNYTRSALFSKKKGEDVFTYLVMEVPNRSGIRIHSANYARQLLGCIALGSIHKDLDMDGQLDVIHSGDTMKAFEKHMNYKPFKLIIS